MVVPPVQSPWGRGDRRSKRGDRWLSRPARAASALRFGGFFGVSCALGGGLLRLGLELGFSLPFGPLGLSLSRFQGLAFLRVGSPPARC